MAELIVEMRLIPSKELLGLDPQSSKRVATLHFEDGQMGKPIHFVALNKATVRYTAISWPYNSDFYNSWPTSSAAR